MFFLRNRIGDNARAGLDVALFAVHEEGADGDAGVEVAAKVGVENSATVYAAAGRFELFDDLHGSDFGRARERARGEAGAEGIERGEVFAERAFKRADQVHDVRVAFHEH